MVDAELNIEVREDIRAASITANIIPRKPEYFQRKYEFHDSQQITLWGFPLSFGEELLLLTVRHDFQYKLNVSHIGTAVGLKANFLALLRIRTGDLREQRRQSIRLMRY